MTAQARLRLEELRKMLPRLPPPGLLTDDQSKMYNDISISLSYALEALARSANDSGKTVARELRDEYAKMFDGSSWQKYILQSLAAELDPLLRDAPQSDRPRSGTPTDTLAKKPKQISQPAPEKSANMTPPEQKQPSCSVTAWIAGALAALVLLGVLIWFLRKK